MKEKVSINENDGKAEMEKLAMEEGIEFNPFRLIENLGLYESNTPRNSTELTEIDEKQELHRKLEEMRDDLKGLIKKIAAITLENLDLREKVNNLNDEAKFYQMRYHAVRKRLSVAEDQLKELDRDRKSVV